MFSFIDSFLNKITMYRVVLYYLIALIIIAGLFGAVGLLPINPLNLAFSTLVLLVISWGTNLAFTKGFNAAANVESVYITALILALIISPVAYTDYTGVTFLIFAAAWAMASKFILNIHQKHLFNPAAFGVAFSALILNQGATWWVGGNLPLMPFVIVGGLLIVRKIQRFDLVVSFAIVALAAIVLTATGGGFFTPIYQTLVHAPFFFLAFVMLTEPLTMPATRLERIAFGALVGLLFAPNVHFGPLYFTPELALLFGNLFAYFVSPEGRFTLTLIEKNEIGAGLYEFVFRPNWTFDFRPGQYFEWTLPHAHPDDRGNRRYFTIASSPTEEDVRLGVKFYEPKSSFKHALDLLQPGETISVANLAGDFVLPHSRQKKLAFIAGGIGITPFRSMVQYLVDTKDARSLVLLYANRTAQEVSYKNIFDAAAEKIGMKTVYALTAETELVPWAHAGRIDAALIASEIPDYKERTFFISGPPAMVKAAQKSLLSLGISRFAIKTDYFPGFA